MKKLFVTLLITTTLTIGLYASSSSINNSITPRSTRSSNHKRKITTEENEHDNLISETTKNTSRYKNNPELAMRTIIEVVNSYQRCSSASPESIDEIKYLADDYIKNLSELESSITKKSAAKRTPEAWELFTGFNLETDPAANKNSSVTPRGVASYPSNSSLLNSLNNCSVSK